MRIGKRRGRVVDHEEARRILGVTSRQFRLMTRANTFPQSLPGAGIRYRWWDIIEVKRRMDVYRGWGWMVPETLYTMYDAFAELDSREIGRCGRVRESIRKKYPWQI